MTVRLESTTRRYIGHSTDPKPQLGKQLDGSTVEATDLGPGSSFLEEDTGRVLRWNGSTWTLPSTEDGRQLQVLETIAADLHSLRDLVEAAV